MRDKAPQPWGVLGKSGLQTDSAKSIPERAFNRQKIARYVAAMRNGAILGYPFSQLKRVASL